MDEQILADFTDESKRLVSSLLNILKEIKGQFGQVKRLEEYGNQVDRIMGGAQSLALMIEDDHAIKIIAEYTALCKSVSYKAAQIQDENSFFEICVTLLTEATRTLEMLLVRIHESPESLRKAIPRDFVEKFSKFAEQLGVNVKGLAGGIHSKMSQTEIDDLMKKLKP